ncbi:MULTISPECIES: hypothetical protein [unclassified Lysobacter]|nr:MULTISPECIES: hypothetical protein [unclassified Lysobacter]MBT2747962.1 hypothetical protein [Lysobacter sp. ISL-42]MBT2753698.1 hypothetical protein [Lysobacter sp. ISL-50]MBT2779195.1 hypothetical protein [Lysobacter sp. ISL-54]
MPAVKDRPAAATAPPAQADNDAGIDASRERAKGAFKPITRNAANS